MALVAFHALTGKQVRELQLIDIVDGRLFLEGRDIPLAAPGHHRRTAPRLVPGGTLLPWKASAVRPRALREDRILHEIHATGGDVRRICDLVGLSLAGATRYLSTVEHPDLTIEGVRTP